MNIKIEKIKDRTAEYILKALSIGSISIIVFVFAFIFAKAWPVLKTSGLGFLFNSGFDAQIAEAYGAASHTIIFQYGALGLLTGTFLSTFIAMAIALPLGIGTAIVISQYAPNWMKGLLTSFIRLLASIPSIVFGLVGVMAVVPLIKKLFITDDIVIKFLSKEFVENPFQVTGRNLLAVSVVLAFMIVPMVVSLSVDAINAVPNHFKEAGFSFGMTKWRVIWKIMLPTAKSGIMAGIILAIGRGIGEAIAVSMVCGGIGFIPDPRHGGVFFLTPILSLAAAIINKSEIFAVPSVEAALFSCGAVLLFFGAVFSIGSKLVENMVRKKEGSDA